MLLLRLRQLCIHPALLIDGEAHFYRHRTSNAADQVLSLAEQTIAKKEEIKQAIKEDAKRARTEVGPGFVELVKKKLLEAAVERIEAEHRGTEAAEDECAICMVRSLSRIREALKPADIP